MTQRDGSYILTYIGVKSYIWMILGCLNSYRCLVYVNVHKIHDFHSHRSTGYFDRRAFGGYTNFGPNHVLYFHIAGTRLFRVSYQKNAHHSPHYYFNNS